MKYGAILLVGFLVITSCGGLDPRQLANEYCDCHKQYGNNDDLKWKCDSLARENNRKMKNNEEAVRAYNVQLENCLEE